MAEKKKVRIGLGTFDLVKGIAIAVVVFSHSVSRYTLNDFSFLSPLYYFMYILGMGFMPMFFIISGYGFKVKPVGKMLKKTFSELIIPYLVTVLISIFLYNVMHVKIYDLPFLLKNTGDCILGGLLCTDIAGPLWFFIALFIANNVLNLILSMKKTALQMMLVMSSVILGFVLMHFHFGYFRLIQGLTAVGFCFIGYVIKKKKFLERYIYSPWLYLLLAPICIAQAVSVVLAMNGQGNSLLLFDMATGEYSVLSYVFSGCTGLLLMLVGVLCNKIEWKCLEWVREFGVYSYWILLVHTIEYNAFPWFHMFVENSSIYSAFVIEIGLKISFIVFGCSVYKKFTQIKYKNKMKNR